MPISKILPSGSRGQRSAASKPDGGVRKLGVPCVVDRLIQQALLQVLQKRWDPTFSRHSYGFRPGRSAHQAVAQAQQYIAAGYSVVVDLDLEKFFDRVNHDSDEVAYVLSGEITLKIGDAVTVGGPGTCAFMRRDVAHAWKSTGAETGRVLFMYTPERAGKLFEEMVERPVDPMNQQEFCRRCFNRLAACRTGV